MTFSGINLPRLSVEPGLRSGRSPLEGYQRAWGLQFGDLAGQVTASPLFQEAVSAMRGRSIVDKPRLYNLFLLAAVFLGRLRSKNVIEFGSFRGGTTLFLATLLARLYPDAKIYSLDTFSGMPNVDKSLDEHSAGDFQDADLDGFRAAIRDARLTNVEIAIGLFEDTFPAIRASGVEFGLVHIDCDIYSAVRYAQDAIWPNVVPGGYVAFDDATTSSCLGATQAVEELIIERKLHSEQIWPHFVFRAGLLVQ